MKEFFTCYPVFSILVVIFIITFIIDFFLPDYDED